MKGSHQPQQQGSTNPPAEASTYGSGSINATFASDILRLQDLWTGIMWSLLSPLSRVLITIVYAFTVSPQVRPFRHGQDQIPMISIDVQWITPEKSAHGCRCDMCPGGGSGPVSLSDHLCDGTTGLFFCSCSLLFIGSSWNNWSLATPGCYELKCLNSGQIHWIGV